MGRQGNGAGGEVNVREERERQGNGWQGNVVVGCRRSALARFGGSGGGSGGWRAGLTMSWRNDRLWLC